MEWPVVELLSVARLVNERVQPFDGARAYIDTGALASDGTILHKVDITYAERPSRADLEAEPGDVLLARMRGTVKVALVTEEMASNVYSTGFAILRPERSALYPGYLAHYVRSPRFQAEKDRYADGAIQPAISNKGFGHLKIPLPPLSEQRRIVEILDQADRLRRLRAEADAKADRILPALFIKMFGDPATNPMGWPVVPLGELSVIGPQYGANASSKPLSPGEPRYIRITDVREDGGLTDEPVGIDLADYQPYLLEENDILFARSGATVGKTYIHRDVEQPCVFAGYLIRFRLDSERLHPLVAFAFTRTAAYRNWVEAKRRTAAQPNINGQEYAALGVPIPNRNLQERFVAHYVRLEANRKNRVRCRLQVERAFSVIINRAFSGSLTASWREAHLKELLQEMEHQARVLEAASR